MKNDEDDAFALSRATELGLNPAALADVEFVVDIHDRSDQSTVVSRLSECGFECRVWDDPVDKSLSVYAVRRIYPTLESILEQKEAIKKVLAGIDVSVEDWGASI